MKYAFIFSVMLLWCVGTNLYMFGKMDGHVERVAFKALPKPHTTKYVTATPEQAAMWVLDLYNEKMPQKQASLLSAMEYANNGN